MIFLNEKNVFLTWFFVRINTAGNIKINVWWWVMPNPIKNKIKANQFKLPVFLNLRAEKNIPNVIATFKGNTSGTMA